MFNTVDKYKITIITATAFFVLLSTSCSKDWLELKSNKARVIPEDLSELQALLDNDNYLNGAWEWMTEISCDDHYVPDDSYNNSPDPIAKNFYIWAKDIYQGAIDNAVTECWSTPYRTILYANTALDGLERITLDRSNQDAYNNVKGSALFFRAFALYNLNQAFAPVYNKATAQQDLGVPIRLKAEIESPSVRASIQENYDRMITDLENSYPLLPVMPIVKTRPSKVASLALLARIYLAMDEYPKALEYADMALSDYNVLMDYNELDSAKTYPFPELNDEVIFHCTKSSHRFTSYPAGKVDSVLYGSYDPDDLRKGLFYRKRPDGGISFRGSYNSSLLQYAGLVVDELYLIRAECYARLNQNNEALEDLNTLLRTRYRAGKFMPVSTGSVEETLPIVLEERRKELAYRGLRWTDLRRLNKDPQFAKTLVRVIDGVTYELPPNDPRYTLPIPVNIIELSGIPQNPR